MEDVKVNKFIKTPVQWKMVDCRPKMSFSKEPRVQSVIVMDHEIL